MRYATKSLSLKALAAYEKTPRYPVFSFATKQEDTPVLLHSK
jgi:hypothetical protein